MVHGLQVAIHADTSNVTDDSWAAIKKHIASLPNVGFYYTNSQSLTERKAIEVKSGASEGVIPIMKRGN